MEEQLNVHDNCHSPRPHVLPRPWRVHKGETGMSAPKVVYDGDRFVVVNPDSEYCGFYGELWYLDTDGRLGIRLDPDRMRSQWEIAFRPDELELVSREAELSADICELCEGPGEPRPGLDMNPAVVSVLCYECYEALGKSGEARPE
jgi:hypothetical protein